MASTTKKGRIEEGLCVGSDACVPGSDVGPSSGYYLGRYDQST